MSILAFHLGAHSHLVPSGKHYGTSKRQGRSTTSSLAESVLPLFSSLRHFARTVAAALRAYAQIQLLRLRFSYLGSLLRSERLGVSEEILLLAAHGHDISAVLELPATTMRVHLAVVCRAHTVSLPVALQYSDAAEPRDYIGIMEKNMENTTKYIGLYRENGKWKLLLGV